MFDWYSAGWIIGLIVGIILGWVIPEPVFARNFLTWAWNAFTGWVSQFFVKKS
jgi:hypothetical protein